jgi:DNA replicative helicase MCM subunit Mcm2 (Cdc46/Mcm family)
LFNKKGFVEKLNNPNVKPEERKYFYRLLEKEILGIFAKDFYKDEKELQEDFINLKRNKDYKEILKMVLDKIEDDLGIVLSVEDLSRLSANRFKLCSVCKKPFLTFDNFNKMKICYKIDYVKYKMKTKDKKEYFNNSLKVSVCFMEYRNIISSAYYHKTK